MTMIVLSVAVAMLAAYYHLLSPHSRRCEGGVLWRGVLFASSVLTEEPDGSKNGGIRCLHPY